MERGCHINFAMIEGIGINGIDGSKVVTSTDQTKQPCGSIVSFHNIHYKVQQKTGLFCKTTSRDILVNLRSVMNPPISVLLLPVCLFILAHLPFSISPQSELYTHTCICCKSSCRSPSKHFFFKFWVARCKMQQIQVYV